MAPRRCSTSVWRKRWSRCRQRASGARSLAEDHEPGRTKWRWPDPGHGRLHEPRAGAWQVAGQTDGYLVVRVRALRNAHGPCGRSPGKPSPTRSPRFWSASRTERCCRPTRPYRFVDCCVGVWKRIVRRRLDSASRCSTGDRRCDCISGRRDAGQRRGDCRYWPSPT